MESFKLLADPMKTPVAASIEADGQCRTTTRSWPNVWLRACLLRGRCSSVAVPMRTSTGTGLANRQSVHAVSKRSNEIRRLHHSYRAAALAELDLALRRPGGNRREPQVSVGPRHRGQRPFG